MLCLNHVVMCVCVCMYGMYAIHRYTFPTACLLGGDSVTKGMQRDLIRKEVCQGKNVGFAKFLSALGI